MSAASTPFRPPFDDAAAAALAVRLRAAARACDSTRAALRRDRSAVATSWRGPAGDDVLDRAGRLVADLERIAASCAHRAHWVEQLRANVATTTPVMSSGLSLPPGFRVGPPVVLPGQGAHSG